VYPVGGELVVCLFVCLCVHFSADFEILSKLRVQISKKSKNNTSAYICPHGQNQHVCKQANPQYQMRRAVRSIIVASKRTTLLAKRTHGVVTSIGHAPLSSFGSGSVVA
jgi:hypothetical protein